MNFSSLLDQPGYDPQTGILFDPSGVEYLPIPSHPTEEDALVALGELKALISTFPFVNDAGDDEKPVAPQICSSRSVALSGIITAMIRRTLPTAPMHGFDAPVAGSGKSKLVDIASLIAHGHEAAVISQGKTEEEMEKRLGAALIAGDGLISIDNAEQPIGGELICQVLTQTMLKVRPLGFSKLVEVPSNAAIFATGNNLTVAGDMTRRALICLIDPQHERPEMREFDTDPIAVIKADRPKYVAAVLTILRAFHAAGCPSQSKPLGSFEVWSKWVRDPLIWLGEPDPVNTMERARKNDPKVEALTNVVLQWHGLIQDRQTSVKEVIAVATLQKVGQEFSSNPDRFVNADFREALLVVAGDGGAISSRRLGKWLAANKGRIVRKCKFTQDGGRAGVVHWRLVGQPDGGF